MSEYLHLPQAELIDDESERLFAMAFLMSFPELSLNHEYTLVAMSGKKKRKTVVDFRVVNQRGEELFIEIASGNKATKRKKKQHKTAALAGFGQVHLTLFGKDLEQLMDSDKSMRQVIISLLSGRYNGNLFSFDE